MSILDPQPSGVSSPLYNIYIYIYIYMHEDLRYMYIGTCMHGRYCRCMHEVKVAVYSETFYCCWTEVDTNFNDVYVLHVANTGVHRLIRCFCG